jgi:hypothetical protein
LVENLRVAEEIGMRGELIDVALTFKILCTKYLEDMVKHAGHEDEDEGMAQVFTISEEDRQLSCYDAKYDKYINNVDDSVFPGIEGNLVTHPYCTDYMYLASNMNKNYLKNNKIESRKMLMDEENYELVNIFTRCAFILTDGGLDSAKTLDY